MGLFGNKKKRLELPDLPEPPTFPEIQEVRSSFGQSAIPNLPPSLQYNQPSEPEEENYNYEPEEEHNAYDYGIGKQTKRSNEPIFVRIEKINQIMDTIEDINGKIKVLSATLLNLREIRKKEADEIARWEKEIIEIKKKITEIDGKLFKK